MSSKTQKKESVETIIDKIDQSFSKGLFKNFIDFIQFPRYKNFANDTVLEFNFPVTVLVGKNGSGKSSVLHALYGAPQGYSTGSFWFSTTVDPIEESQSDPHCFFYVYSNEQGKKLEVLKTRVRTKTQNPDYWEPSRPIEKYGMTLLEGKRNDAVKKNVIYLDFRAELSAFDRYFYFGNFSKTKTLKNKQDVIRKWAKLLRTAIDGRKAVKYRRIGKRKSKRPVTLSQEELDVIKTILGKEYSECILVDHNFYDGRPDPGAMAYFRTNHINYSEAFAGRGEFAVVQLVHAIHQAEDNSLVLLDEPEVSLHPGAQEALKKYLLQSALKKHLQIVISTHSRTFVEKMPEKAIKLFYETEESKFSILNSCHYLEAFKDIGVVRHESEKAIILVEDVTAKIIIDRFLEFLGGGFAEIFRVEFFPGGAEDLLKKAAFYSQENDKRWFIVLDGDKTRSHPDPDDFTQRDRSNFIFLQQQVLEASGINFRNLPLTKDGGNDSAAHESQKINSAIKYLSYLHFCVRFLPGQIPEDLIWDNRYANHLLDGKKHSWVKDPKKNICQLAKESGGSQESENIHYIKCYLAKKLAEDGTNRYHIAIKDILEHFKTIYTESLQT